MKKKIELLSPVGNIESLYAAINSGADSIYYGVEQLNMRSINSSFSIKDIKKINNICFKKKIKKYLTLNSIIYDHDINLTKKILHLAKDNNINGIIAMDPFVINYCNKIKIPVHISTQLNITNIESLKFYSKFADVFVLSRELNLNQIKYICKKINNDNIIGFSKKKIKIEIFCHGSLCMAISGKCYISLHSYNSSANRGACKQNCRRKYLVKDKISNFKMKIDNEYIMSPKDLCTINFLDKIVKTGINILKIEGRGKSADYVSECTKSYKKALFYIKKNKYNEKNKKKLINNLKKVYNRGFWNGYYLGEKIGKWTNNDGSKAREKKIFIGIIIKYLNIKKIAILDIKNFNLKKNDKILIIGNKIGVINYKIKSLRDKNKKKKKKIENNNICTFFIPFKVYPKNKVYKLINN